MDYSTVLFVFFLHGRETGNCPYQDSIIPCSIPFVNYFFSSFSLFSVFLAVSIEKNASVCYNGEGIYRREVRARCGGEALFFFWYVRCCFVPVTPTASRRR
jgi:hypothetical protein